MNLNKYETEYMDKYWDYYHGYQPRPPRVIKSKLVEEEQEQKKPEQPEKKPSPKNNKKKRPNNTKKQQSPKKEAAWKPADLSKAEEKLKKNFVASNNQKLILFPKIIVNSFGTEPERIPDSELDSVETEIKA